MYTNEENILILISLLKQYNIRYIVASPGATNITFLMSVQNDNWFKIISCVDERSSCYMACGIAAQNNEPVVLTCTGATASRNYLSGLTEAYYRKLPILAVTSTQNLSRVGSYIPQVIDRSVIQNDVSIYNVCIDKTFTNEESLSNNLKINEALINLTVNRGPVHINLVTDYSDRFNVVELPKTRKIKYFQKNNKLPKITANNVAIYIGNHKPFSTEEVKIIDEFCVKYNAFVYIDHTSNYSGKYGILYSLKAVQPDISITRCPDLLIHIGYVSGAYMEIWPKRVWRVNSDGSLIDTFGKLDSVFKMHEIDFFKFYNDSMNKNDSNEVLSYFKKANCELESLYSKIPSIPFSNIWIAKQTANKIPKNSILHLGILNSLRTWNFFHIDKSVECYSNTGGFGIDGCMSSCIGSAIVNQRKLHFIVLGDLSFFYDMNSIGNNNISNNLRILLINNGCGTEFKNYNHPAAKFGDDANKYIAALGHFGYKSKELVKNYAQDLGYKYLTAQNKNEYVKNLEDFLCTKSDKSIIFEVFTHYEKESESLKLLHNLESIHITNQYFLKNKIKNIIGQKNVDYIKKMKGAIIHEED